MKTIKPKPVEHEVHLKYLCPYCGDVHWLSFDEAATKDYKVVCYCKKIFSVKRVKKIKVLYASKPKAKPIIKKEETKPTVQTQKINNSLLEKATSIMINYGFTKDEAISDITKTYNLNPIEDCIELVKQTLVSMR